LIKESSLKKIDSSKNLATLAETILGFYRQLSPDFVIPREVSIMDPFNDPAKWPVTEAFYRKYYSDQKSRILIFGINPGRFGGGVTGIPFTDPIRLERNCGIRNDFRKIAELSSHFIYAVAERYGGVKKFYKDYFITALSPIGFTKNGTNLNYYDEKDLLKATEPFIVDCIKKQVNAIQPNNIAFCLGEGTNYKIFSRLNEKYDFFKDIIPLPHPRWIMQYRRKQMDEFVALYVKELSAVSFQQSVKT
jgi:hypothetical protein